MSSNRKFSNSVERLRTEVRQLLAEYSADSERANSSQPNDLQQETLLSKLHKAREASGQDRLSTEEVEDQMLTMTFAEYETTAAALGFAWYSLAINSDIRQAFHDVLDAVLEDEPPTPEDIANLDLTNRIVTEPLRLYPPIHTIPRETTRDVQVDGYWIPAEEEVHLSIISTHRDERFYADPCHSGPTGGQMISKRNSLTTRSSHSVVVVGRVSVGSLLASRRRWCWRRSVNSGLSNGLMGTRRSQSNRRSLRRQRTASQCGFGSDRQTQYTSTQYTSRTER